MRQRTTKGTLLKATVLVRKVRAGEVGSRWLDQKMKKRKYSNAKLTFCFTCKRSRRRLARTRRCRVRDKRLCLVQALVRFQRSVCLILKVTVHRDWMDRYITGRPWTKMKASGPGQADIPQSRRLPVPAFAEAPPGDTEDHWKETIQPPPKPERAGRSRQNRLPSTRKRACCLTQGRRKICGYP